MVPPNTGPAGRITQRGSGDKQIQSRPKDEMRAVLALFWRPPRVYSEKKSALSRIKLPEEKERPNEPRDG
jgi:hypothetical protein